MLAILFYPITLTLVTLETIRDIWSERAARRAALVARAEYEHQLYLQGDPRGIYGQYTPAT
ncbi:hypothetical protein [Nocardia sp. CA-119907]|uniref:hypothetical protein n=1 Tax=Nocardia sp. CA-119907 TaxID=3239973 RepID=UPI003D9892CD